MDKKEFTALVKATVVDYAGSNRDWGDGTQLKENDVDIVWMGKALRDNKALAYTALTDEMYYEVTYNGSERTLHVDVYRKEQSFTVAV